jgi:hypothetical protein
LFAHIILNGTNLKQFLIQNPSSMLNSEPTEASHDYEGQSMNKVIPFFEIIIKSLIFPNNLHLEARISTTI